MQKNKIRFLLLFVFAILLLLANMGVGLAMLYKPIANTQCHNQNNDLQNQRRGVEKYGQKIPFQTLEYGYRYTCNRYPTDKDKLSDYCKSQTNSISLRQTGANAPSCGMNGLACHICVCDDGYTTAIANDGTPKCCKVENIDPKTNKCCSSEDGGFPPNSDADCDAFNNTKSPISATNQDKNDTKPEDQIDNQNSENTENQGGSDVNPKNQTSNQNSESKTNQTGNGTKIEDCGIKDSQGKCCKKTYYDLQLKREACCEGVLLSTNVPFIGQCIVFKKNKDHTPEAGLVVDEDTAFPILMGGISKIMVSLILLTGFLGILIGGVMIAAAGAGDSKKGKKIIGNVISALALLGASGVILHLINPNFFG